MVDDSGIPGVPVETVPYVTEANVSKAVVKSIVWYSVSTDVLRVELGEVELTWYGTVELCLLTGGINLKVFLVVDSVVDLVVVRVVVVVGVVVVVVVGAVVVVVVGVVVCAVIWPVSLEVLDKGSWLEGRFGVFPIDCDPIEILEPDETACPLVELAPF